jgi:hypothetical protein
MESYAGFDVEMQTPAAISHDFDLPARRLCFPPRLVTFLGVSHFLLESPSTSEVE